MLATLAEVHASQWTRTEHLLANVSDLLGVVAYNALMGPHADPKKLRRMKPPKPMARPGLTPRKRRKATSEDLMQIFGSGHHRPQEVKLKNG